MKAFIDTSSLIKKYIDEIGSEDLLVLLKDFNEIVVSPTAWLEFNSTIERLQREKLLSMEAALSVKSEARIDFHSFMVVYWNEQLEEKGLEFIQKYQMKTLDSIQLAAASLSQPKTFITSDKKLHSIAKKEFDKTVLI